MLIHFYKDSPTAGGVDGTLVSEQIDSTLTVQAAIGATTITVADAANFYASLQIKIESESATILSVDYATKVITLTAALTAAHSIGAIVINTSAESAPITTADAITAGNESPAITCAIRCESGYQTSGNTTITPDGGSTDVDWALSLDGTTWGEWGVALTITAAVTAVNTLFYAKYKVVAGELPINDAVPNFITTATIISAA